MIYRRTAATRCCGGTRWVLDWYGVDDAVRAAAGGSCRWELELDAAAGASGWVSETATGRRSSTWGLIRCTVALQPSAASLSAPVLDRDTCARRAATAAWTF